MSNNTYNILYNNLMAVFKNNGIQIVGEIKNELELFNNVKIGSYERIEIDGKKDGKDYKIVLLPMQNKYTKKNNLTDLIGRYYLAYHKIMVVCVKEEQLNKLRNVVKLIDNEGLNKFITCSYKPFMYNLLEHCHGNTISILSKEEVELMMDSYKFELHDLPKIIAKSDPLILWHFDLVNKGDVIMVDDVSDNSGGILLPRLVI